MAHFRGIFCHPGLLLPPWQSLPLADLASLDHPRTICPSSCTAFTSKTSRHQDCHHSSAKGRGCYPPIWPSPAPKRCSQLVTYLDVATELAGTNPYASSDRAQEPGNIPPRPHPFDLRRLSHTRLPASYKFPVVFCPAVTPQGHHYLSPVSFPFRPDGPPGPGPETASNPFTVVNPAIRRLLLLVLCGTCSRSVLLASAAPGHALLIRVFAAQNECLSPSSPASLSSPRSLPYPPSVGRTHHPSLTLPSWRVQLAQPRALPFLWTELHS